MALYHSKPATVGAWIYDGSRESRHDLLERLGHLGRSDVGDGGYVALMVLTNNGWVEVKPGHYLVKGVSDFYPCDPETFEARWQLGRSSTEQRNQRAVGPLADWLYAHPEVSAEFVSPEAAEVDPNYSATKVALQILEKHFGESAKTGANA